MDLTKYYETIKNTPLETRLRVYFWLEWMDLYFKDREPRSHAEQENQQAWQWAEKSVKSVLNEVREWQDDGSPMQDTQTDIAGVYSDWCKSTGRNGGILIGKSFKEFFEHINTNYTIKQKDEQQV